MKLTWKKVAWAALIGLTCSAAYEKGQEWEVPAAVSQYYQDLFYGEQAEPVVIDPLEAQIEARRQQAVDRGIQGKAMRVVDHSADTLSTPSYGGGRFRAREYTKQTQHGTLTIRHISGRDGFKRLLVFWEKSGAATADEKKSHVFGWRQDQWRHLGAGRRTYITAYRPGDDWEKALDEIQLEVDADEKAAREQSQAEERVKKEKELDRTKKNWGLDERVAAEGVEQKIAVTQEFINATQEFVNAIRRGNAIRAKLYELDKSPGGGQVAQD